LRAVFDHFDLGAFAQAVGAFQHQAVAGGQAFEDHAVLAIAGADLELADVDLAVLVDHVGEGAVVAELDRRGRGQHHLLEGVGQQAHVDELVGEQRLVLVLERPLNFRVPVVVSIWLSRLPSTPVACSLRSPRSQASTGRLAPLR
jgi:hypothetical protein